MKFIHLLIVFLLISVASFAEEPEKLPEFDYFSDFINMLISLVFVIVLILLTTWFLKRFSRTRLRRFNHATNIKILERRILNPKASLYLVDILGKGVLIAESQQGIQLITEFPEGTNLELLIDEKQSEVKTPISFGEIFSKIKNKMQKTSK